MLVCDCKRKCQVGSCSCIDNGLNCWEAYSYQGCENMAKEIDDIEEDDDLLQKFSDDDDHFDDDVFLSFQNVYFPELYFESEILFKF